MYALGYRELTGSDADLVEIHNLDKDGRSHRREVDDAMLTTLSPRVATAGQSLRDNHLPKLATWCKTSVRTVTSRESAAIGGTIRLHEVRLKDWS